MRSHARESVRTRGVDARVSRAGVARARRAHLGEHRRRPNGSQPCVELTGRDAMRGDPQGVHRGSPTHLALRLSANAVWNDGVGSRRNGRVHEDELRDQGPSRLRGPAAAGLRAERTRADVRSECDVGSAVTSPRIAPPRSPSPSPCPPESVAHPATHARELDHRSFPVRAMRSPSGPRRRDVW